MNDKPNRWLSARDSPGAEPILYPNAQIEAVGAAGGGTGGLLRLTVSKVESQGRAG